MNPLRTDSEGDCTIDQLLDYKARLERDRNRSVNLEEAARAWVRDYARFFRNERKERKSLGDS